MNLYFCRVELRGSPSDETYGLLHKRMAGIGFMQKIEGNNKTYDLPHAMYAGNQELDFNTVNLAAIGVAQGVQAEALILTIQANDSGWRLDPSNPPVQAPSSLRSQLPNVTPGARKLLDHLYPSPPTIPTFKGFNQK